MLFWLFVIGGVVGWLALMVFAVMLVSFASERVPWPEPMTRTPPEGTWHTPPEWTERQRRLFEEVN